MKTLAMLKMEKNLVAVIEKKYPRKPYERFTIGHFLDRLEEELNEAIDAYQRIDWKAFKEELADISNITDYLFERATFKETEN